MLLYSAHLSSFTVLYTLSKYSQSIKNFEKKENGFFFISILLNFLWIIFQKPIFFLVLIFFFASFHCDVSMDGWIFLLNLNFSKFYFHAFCYVKCDDDFI